MTTFPAMLLLFGTHADRLPPRASKANSIAAWRGRTLLALCAATHREGLRLSIRIPVFGDDQRPAAEAARHMHTRWWWPQRMAARLTPTWPELLDSGTAEEAGQDLQVSGHVHRGLVFLQGRLGNRPAFTLAGTPGPGLATPFGDRLTPWAANLPAAVGLPGLGQGARIHAPGTLTLCLGAAHPFVDLLRAALPDEASPLLVITGWS